MQYTVYICNIHKITYVHKPWGKNGSKGFFSLRPSPFQKQFGSGKIHRSIISFKKTLWIPNRPCSQSLKSLSQTLNLCSHESNRLGLLVPAAKAFFSFCFFNTAWPWHIPNVSGPLVRCSTVLLDWGTSEGTTNDSSDPSVGEHVCINNGHSIVPEDGVAKLHTLSMI